MNGNANDPNWRLFDAMPGPRIQEGDGHRPTSGPEHPRPPAGGSGTRPPRRYELGIPTLTVLAFVTRDRQSVYVIEVTNPRIVSETPNTEINIPLTLTSLNTMPFVEIGTESLVSTKTYIRLSLAYTGRMAVYQTHGREGVLSPEEICEDWPEATPFVAAAMEYAKLIPPKVSMPERCTICFEMRDGFPLVPWRGEHVHLPCIRSILGVNEARKAIGLPPIEGWGGAQDARGEPRRPDHDAGTRPAP